MSRLICLVVLWISMSACGSGPQVADSAQHFVFNNGAEPEWLDPAKGAGSPETRIIQQLFEGLVELTPGTLAPRPGAAESWTISDDGLIYTFRLREGLTWSDGQPLGAEDFRWSWLRVLNPATGSKYADQLDIIAGAQAHRRGELAAELVGIAVPDAQTLVVTLDGPCPWFLEVLAFNCFLPQPRHAIDAHGDSWTDPGKLVSNGAFMLKDWRQRERIVLERNPRWRDAKNVRLDRITALPIDSLDVAYQQFLSGNLHWMDSVPFGKLDEARRHPDFYTSRFLASYYFRINVTRAPFTDVRVRKALSLGLDRRHLTEHVSRLGETPATWYVPEMTGYTPAAGLAEDAAAARVLLQEAGIDPATLDPIEILYNESETHRALAEAIAQQWRENLGIRAVARPAEWKSYLKAMDSLDYQLVRSGWVGDYHDPFNFLSCFLSDSGNNRTGWKHPGFDAGLTAARTMIDAAARNAAYREMEAILVEQEFPIIPIYIYVNKGLLNRRVRGWQHNDRDMLMCRYLWIE